MGLLCAFAGTALAFGDALRLPTYNELLGDGLAFLAAILWGATTVVIKASRLATIRPHKNLLYQLVVSAILLPVLSRVLGEPGIFAATPLVLGMLAYQIVVVAFASYLAWFWLISRYPAGRLSSFSFLTPLFGVVAGALALSEPVGWMLALALALVGIGLALVDRAAPLPGVTARPVGLGAEAGEC
jgi:drug/metabolite transporter (DMT)-like permease